MASLIIAVFFRFFQNCLKREPQLRFARDFEGTRSAPARRSPRSVGISDSFWGMLESAAHHSPPSGGGGKKVKMTVTFQTSQIEALRSDAPGASQMMTRRGG